MSHNNKLQNPSLIIIRGLPGSGKSFIADKLVEEIFQEPFSVVDPDRIDYESSVYKEFASKLARQNVDPIFFPYRFLRNTAYETIEQRGLVIWTQAFTNLEMLDKTIKNLEKYANDCNLKLDILVVEVEIDENTARDRTKDRANLGLHGVSDEKFKCFVSDYSTFKDFGYKTITVDGKNNVDLSVKNISMSLLSSK